MRVADRPRSPVDPYFTVHTLETLRVNDSYYTEAMSVAIVGAKSQDLAGAVGSVSNFGPIFTSFSGYYTQNQRP